MAVTGNTLLGETAASAASAAPGRGIGILRFGNSYSSGADYSRYQYVIVGPGDAGAAGTLAGTSLVYQSGVDITTGWSSGVPHQTAVARGWLLKDANGGYLTNGFGGYIGDVGDSGYQRAWVHNVASLLAKNGNEGVFIDNVLGDLSGLTGGKLPARYSSQSRMGERDGLFHRLCWTSTQGSRLLRPGRRHKYVAGDPGSDDGSLERRWWRRIGASVSGLMSESWLATPSREQQASSDGALNGSTTGPAGRISSRSLSRWTRFRRAPVCGDNEHSGHDLRQGVLPLDVERCGRRLHVQSRWQCGDPWNNAWTARPWCSRRRASSGRSWLASRLLRWYRPAQPDHFGRSVVFAGNWVSDSRWQRGNGGSAPSDVRDDPEEKRCPEIGYHTEFGARQPIVVGGRRHSLSFIRTWPRLRERNQTIRSHYVPRWFGCDRCDRLRATEPARF